MQLAKLAIKKPLSYLNSGQFISTGPWIHSKRVIDSFEIIVGIKGTLYIEQDNEKYEVKTGDVLCLLPGHKHEGYKFTNENDELSFYWFHFAYNDNYEIIYENSIIDDITLLKNNPYFQGLDEIAYIPIFSHVENISRINILSRQVLDFSNTEYYTKKIIDYLITTLIFQISHQTIDYFTEHMIADNKSLVFTKILEWIRINLNNSISLSDVADKFNFNKNYLARLFKQRMGVTINDYITNLRMARAKELLTQSEMNIKEIAYAAGFDDEKYFMRLFKKSELMTPSQYRNTFYRTNINNT